MNLHRVLGVALFASLITGPVVAEDWPFFRGPTRDGKSLDAAPLEWGKDKNIKWSVKLPRPGNSSPIVTGSHVLLNCAEDAGGVNRSLYCFDRATGNKLWSQTVKYELKEPTHNTNPYCASTPATDGKLVVVWHGSAGLYCYDLSGKQVWKYETGPRRHIWGYGSSPIIHAGVVYLNCGPGAGHYVVAINLADGKELWKIDEPRAADDKFAESKGWVGSWSSPMVAKINGQEQLLIFQSSKVNGYDIKTGKILWSAAGTGDLAYTDVMIDAKSGIGLALGGYGGAGIGFSLGSTPDTAPGKQLWRTTDKPPQRIGSGVIVGNHVYLPSEPSIQCIDITTGKIAWSHRQPGASYWSSIVSSGDRLYATTQNGTTLVFSPDPSGFKLLATNVLGESTNATPAISKGQIFLRTSQHLFCIGE